MIDKTEIVDLLFKFLKGVYFKDKVVKDNYEFWYSDIVDDTYYNCVVVKGQIDFKKVVKETLDFYNPRDRTPTFYLIENQYPELEKYLKENNFESDHGDSWMRYNGKPIDVEITLKAKLCETKEDLALCGKLVNLTYVEGDQVYSDMSTVYDRAIVNSFGTPNNEFYIFYEDETPIGTGQVEWDEKSAGLNTIGVLGKHRKKGYGKQITKFLLEKVKGKDVYIQTEKDSFVEKLYGKLGFDKLFCVNYYNLNRLKFGAFQTMKCCAVKPDEKVIILNDHFSKEVSQYVIDAAKKITQNVKVYNIDELGPRPFTISQKLLDEIKNSDVCIQTTSYVFGEISTYYKPISAFVNQTNLRLAVLVDLDEQILKEGINADYEKIKEFSKKVYEKVKGAKQIKVTTELGTDFTIDLGYKWAILDGFPEKGKWVNLPDGEVLTCPKNLNGKLVFDGVIEWLGILEKPITVEMKDNRVVSVDSYSKDFEEKLKTDENSNRIGEFAFGTNLFLKKLCGNLTQDEKFPSVHVAFGDPHESLTGAEWASELHIDCLIMKPTVWVDGEKVMENGNYLI